MYNCSLQWVIFLWSIIFLVCMDFGGLRVARGGSGAKAPPLAARPNFTHYIDCNLAVSLSCLAVRRVCSAWFAQSACSRNTLLRLMNVGTQLAGVGDRDEVVTVAFDQDTGPASHLHFLNVCFRNGFQVCGVHASVACSLACLVT